MTSVTFHTEVGRITGFEAKGHSGWAEAGEDLLCASITAAVTLVEATVNDVLGLAAAVRIDGDKALISLRLPGALGPTAESTCQTLLAALMVHCVQLAEEYPENITVLEV